MFGITSKITQKIPSAEKIIKQMNFGTAAGLTKTAKEGQAAVQGEAARKLNRKGGGNWFAQQSRVGIRITPAKKDGRPIVAEIKTAAYFGELQDKGGTKVPFSRTHLAIPAKGGPLNGVRKIPDQYKPKALIASGKAWIETTHTGTQLLVTHGLTNKGKNRGDVLWYILVPKAKIKPAEFFYKPIQRVVSSRLLTNVRDAIDEALRTAK